MKYISLFAGIGGFDLALNRLGHECVYANEWDKYAAQIYNKNFGHQESGESLQGTERGSIQYRGDKSDTKVGRDSQPKTWGDRKFQQSKGIDTRDIRTVPTSEIPDHDLLVGGFPCQAFSIAGKRRGFDDTRGTLFFEIARIAKEHKPMFLLLENVKGLVSHDGGKTLKVILETLQSLGYYTNYEIHNSKYYGVPQNRERIFFKCTHIKGLLCIGQESGQKKRTTFSERVIQEFLFQTLLNYLPEVKKLQEHALKDSVVGYLLLKEINQNLKSSDESILGGTGIPMEGSMFQSKEGEVWQNIDTWLSKNLGENLQEVNKSTILTAIKQITESETFTYLQMLKAILYAIVLLRKSSNHLWNEVLSSLTLIQENTKYERINTKAEKGVITESGTLHLTNNLQDFSRYFIVGHIRGQPRPEVFPIRQNSGEITIQGGKETQHSGTITSRYWKQGNADTYIKETQKNSQGARVYGTGGVSTTISSGGGGLGAKTGLYMVGNNTHETVKRKFDVNEGVISEYLKQALKKTGLSKKYVADRLNQPFTQAEHYFRGKDKKGVSLPDKDTWNKLKEILGFDDTYNKEMTTYIQYTTTEHQGNRVYSSEGLAQALNTVQEPTIAFPTNTKKGYAEATEGDGINLSFPNSKTRRGRVIKGNSPTLQSGVQAVGTIQDMKIRRLTPTECERLQGFPDCWTEGISDTQRYKCLGNAVTVNVVYEVARRLNG